MLPTLSQVQSVWVVLLVVKTIVLSAVNALVMLLVLYYNPIVLSELSFTLAKVLTLEHVPVNTLPHGTHAFDILLKLSLLSLWTKWRGLNQVAHVALISKVSLAL